MANRLAILAMVLVASACDGGVGAAVDAAGGVTDAAAIDARPIDAAVDAPSDAPTDAPTDAPVDAPPVPECLIGPQGPPPPPPLPPPPPPSVCPPGTTRCLRSMILCFCGTPGGFAVCGGPPDPP